MSGHVKKHLVVSDVQTAYLIHSRGIHRLFTAQRVHVRCTCEFGDHRPVTCTDNTHISTFCDDLKLSKVGQGDLVLVCDQGSLVGLCLQDHRSLWCAAVTIYATVVNIRHTQRDTQTASDQLI